MSTNDQNEDPFSFSYNYAVYSVELIKLLYMQCGYRVHPKYNNLLSGGNCMLIVCYQIINTRITHMRTTWFIRHEKNIYTGAIIVLSVAMMIW